MHPFTGTWAANLEKSHRHKNHQFREATLRFDVSGDAVSLTQSDINMSGKHESSTLALVADGKEHPVSPQAPGVDASGAAFDQVIVFDREQPGA